MSYGVELLIEELENLGYCPLRILQDPKGVKYALISDYEITIGQFAGKKIELAIPAPDDYPRTVGASIHINTAPPLLEKGNVPGVRNIADSKLGTEWQYWSFRFLAIETETTSNLMQQINGVFRNI